MAFEICFLVKGTTLYYYIIYYYTTLLYYLDFAPQV